MKRAGTGGYLRKVLEAYVRTQVQQHSLCCVEHWTQVLHDFQADPGSIAWGREDIFSALFLAGLTAKDWDAQSDKYEHRWPNTREWVLQGGQMTELPRG